jgi:hypothetical protein
MSVHLEEVNREKLLKFIEKGASRIVQSSQHHPTLFGIDGTDTIHIIDVSDVFIATNDPEAVLNVGRSMMAELGVHSCAFVIEAVVVATDQETINKIKSIEELPDRKPCINVVYQDRLDTHMYVYDLVDRQMGERRVFPNADTMWKFLPSNTVVH